MFLLVLLGFFFLVGAGAIVISIIGAITSLFVKSNTAEKPSDSSDNAQTQEKSAHKQQQILTKENHIAVTSLKTANAKCTFCGAKAFVKGNDVFYICPVCHRKVDIASTKNSFQNPQMSKVVSHDKAQLQHFSSKSLQSSHVTPITTAKPTADSFVIDSGVLIEYKGTDQIISIPQGVFQIGEEAFGKGQLRWIPGGGTYIWRNNIEQVHIHKGVTSIRSKAFWACKNLTQVTIEGDSTDIGFQAFYNCESLTQINLPQNITSISSGTFISCKNLKMIKLPERLQCIESEAFRASGLVEINIPASVRKVGSEAFVRCDGLEKVYIPSTEMEWGYSVFEGCKRLRKIRLPELKTIPFRCFRYCTELAEIEWSNRIRQINTEAFHGCTSLNYLSLPDSITEIGDGAFEGCRNLERIEIPSTLEKIGKGAFQRCYTLSQIVLPQSLHKISRTAFKYCAELSEIILPDSIEKIEYEAFASCEKLRSIRIPKSVSSIEGRAFADCSRLANVIIENGEVYADDCAFVCCDDRLMIHAPEGSPMQRYAKNHGLAFSPLPSLNKNEIYTKEISIADFVVRSNNFKCYFEHDIEQIQAIVSVLLKSGDVRKEKVMAGYCRDCNCYYILDSSFKYLQTNGILLCQLITLAELVKKGTAVFDREGMKAQSVLRRCGYTVNANDNLSATQRQKILAVVVDQGIYSPLELCNFLDWMIGYQGKSSARDMSSAIKKWTEDRIFVERYAGNQGKEVAMKSISYRSGL